MAKAKKAKKAVKNDADTWFNFFRYPKSDKARQFVSELLSEFEKQEKRQRARKEQDRIQFSQIGNALVANLAYYHLNGASGTGLIVPRAKSALGKATRYQPAFPRTLPKLLNDLERFGYLEQTRGKFSGQPGRSRSTTIRPGPRLVQLLENHQLAFEDFALDDMEELIILKRRKRGFWDQSAPIGYKDNATTNHFRFELVQMNAWLEDANIAFDGKAAAYNRPVDTRARRMFRYFSGDFKSGGRLFRGFWENLPPEARLHGLEIDGERVVELDYAQLNPMLAYAKVGCSPPAGDAYALPGLEAHRDGVKKVFNALLFATRPRKSFPKGVSGLFPPKTKIGDVIAAIHEKHPLIVSVLSTGAGFGLMFVESEIMIAVLKELRSREIVGLPVHDAVIVKSSEREAATAVMKEQFRKRTGLEIKVRAEDASRAEAA